VRSYFTPVPRRPTTTRDPLKWEQALFARKVVSRALLERRITPFKNDYALGVTSTLVNGRRRIAHGGGIDGFNTQLVLTGAAGGADAAVTGQFDPLSRCFELTATGRHRQ